MNDDLEERMRQAVAKVALAPDPNVWEAIAAQHRVPKGSGLAKGLIYAGTAAMAAGLLYLIQPHPKAVPELSHRPPEGDQDQGSFFSPAALLAQSSPIPAFPQPQQDEPIGTRLREGQWRYRSTDRSGDTLPWVLTYGMRKGSLDGIAAWLLTTSSTHPTSRMGEDSLWATRDSLRPLLRITHPSGSRIEQTFRQDEVLQGTTRNGYTAWSTIPLTDSTRHHPSAIIRWQEIAAYFQTIPLDSNWRGSVPLTGAAEFGAIRPVWLNFKVDGEEVISTPAGRFACWRIVLAFGLPKTWAYDPDHPPPGVYFWISKEKQWMIQQGYVNPGQGMFRQFLIDGNEPP